MKKSYFKVFAVFICSILIISCGTKASQSFKNSGDGHLNTAKRLHIPYPAGPFEGPQRSKVTDVLPRELVYGPNHSVQHSVLNDGYLYIYTINSKYGQIRAVSTAMARKRIHEINAIAEIEKMSKGEEFVDGVTEKVKDVGKGAVNLVTHPIDTISGAASGVSKLFSRASENIVGQARSDAEDNRIKSIAGFAKTKRDYGYDLNVDVYSRNPLLQDALDDLTWSGFSGNLVMAMTVAAVTGPLVSTVGATNLMNKVFRDTAPADLRIMNREKLKNMQVTDSTADLFIENGIFTPREQTLLVNALDGMNNTRNREAFIKFATNTYDPDVVFFRKRVAEMYANYNQVISPISQFKDLMPFTVGLAGKNKLVLCVPFDHLLWTADMAKIATLLNQKITELSWVKQKSMVVGGTVSPIAREKLTEMGWDISERMF